MAKGKYEYWLTNKQVTKELKADVMWELVGKEKDLEDNIIENIKEICEGLHLPSIKEIGRQKMINTGDFYIKPDIMVRHTDGTMTVFEVKKDSTKYPSTGTTNQMNAVGQLLLYKNVLESVIGGLVRVALIDNKIHYRTYCAFIGNKLPITLIDFQKNRVFIPYNGWMVAS